MVDPIVIVHASVFIRVFTPLASAHVDDLFGQPTIASSVLGLEFYMNV